MSKVFIGMPVYNGERFIKEAIDSLLEQSFKDFTLFISDDASTDGTQEICKEYTKKDSRVIYFRQPKNLGMFPSFRFIIDKANSEFFMMAAQDDVWNKDFLQICVDNLEKNKNLGFAMTNMIEIDSRGQKVRELDLQKFSSTKPNLRTVAKYILEPEILGKGNLMYSFFRLEVAKTVWKIYPQRTSWGSDYLFSLALISHFGGMINEQKLFMKRYGGFSNPIAIDNAYVERLLKLNPKNRIFPFGRTKQYFNGHIEALKGSPYLFAGITLFVFRIPRAFLIATKEKLNGIRKLLKAFDTKRIHKNKQRTLDYYKGKFNLKTLVETGTYKGDMVEAMRGKFEKIYSIELGENLCKDAQERFRNNADIEILCGNSEKVLSDLVPKLNKPTLFWLDAHFSRGITAKADLDTPIVKELEIIFRNKINGWVILIDDAVLFNGTNDYPAIEKVQKMANDNNMVCEVKNDIMRIFERK